jgi:GNAT superfamily N-acetyltransferase
MLGADSKGDDAAAFQVTDLTFNDLEDIGWSGSITHLEAVRVALCRVPTGEVEYLAVRGPDGKPVAIGGVDYTSHAPAGTIWQLITREDLRGKGAGTLLIIELEDRMRRHGVLTSMLGVETGNTRARDLYTRLGYRPCGHEQEFWIAEHDDGTLTTHCDDIDLLGRTLWPRPSTCC